MMDGRFDQHLAEIFAASLADEGTKSERSSLWPLMFACFFGLAVFVCASVLG